MTSYYVRTDGGTPEQCTGRADAPIPAADRPGVRLGPPFPRPAAGWRTAASRGRHADHRAGSYRMGIGAPGADGCEAD